MRVLGIDFGTSNTVALLRSAGGRTRPLLFDGSPLLPSAVHLSTDGRPLVGGDAERAARLDPARFEPNPKRRIDDGAVLLGGREVPVPRLISAVLARVAAEARRQLGGGRWGPDELRMTYPAGWGERRRAVLAEAARTAGLPPPWLVAEPVAAAAYYTAVLGNAAPVGQALAIYDLGGGTFDAAVVRRTPAGYVVLADSGLADLGGVDFDQAIVEHLGRRFAPGRPGPSHGPDNSGWDRLLNPSDVGGRRQRALLYSDVRAAKESLSRAAAAEVYLPVLDVRAHLTRAELEDLLRPYLARTIGCLAATVADAGLDPAELVGIFLVGGSSRIPLAAHLVHTGLGAAPTTLEQPETVVAEGCLCLPSRSTLAHRSARSGPAHPAPVAGRSPMRQPPGTPPRPVGPPPVPPAAASTPSAPPVPAPPAARTPPAASPPWKPWYAEPVIVATLVVLILVVAASIILIAAAI